MSEEFKNVSLEDYQKAVRLTNLNTGDELYSAIGLANEVGEALGIIKKMMRGDSKYQNKEYRIEKLESELGDVLWYLVSLCQSLDIEFQDIVDINTAKILRRLEEGTIRGDGDDR